MIWNIIWTLIALAAIWVVHVSIHNAGVAICNTMVKIEHNRLRIRVIKNQIPVEGSA